MAKTCNYCDKEFSEDVVGRVFSNHVRWCDKNPNRNKTENLKKAVNKVMDEKLGLVKPFKVFCYKCKKPLLVEEREFNFPSKDKYFCSSKCSHSRNHSQECKDKISKIISDKVKNGEITNFGGYPAAKYELRKCPQCNNDFNVNANSDKVYCDVICFRKHKKSTDEFSVYKQECQFKFNLWKYPEEFNLELIKKYGWYKAYNHGNNLTGVSRDHKISVMYGWENKIPSEIIRHPANCELMQHNKNSSKHSKCSVKLEQLTESIKIWNEKYVPKV